MKGIYVIMYYLYALYYKNKIFYIGIATNAKRRFWQHKYICFCENQKNHKHHVYRYIRNLNITKDNFYENIKMKVIRSYENKEKAEKVENAIIKRKWNEWNLQNSHFK